MQRKSGISKDECRIRIFGLNVACTWIRDRDVLLPCSTRTFTLKKPSAIVSLDLVEITHVVED